MHSLKAHLYQCIGRTDVGGPEDLTPDTLPDPQQPEKPGTLVVDPVKPDEPKPEKPGTAVVDPPRPTISCVNGVVRNGACECEATMKPVKASKNAWRCVLNPKPVKPIVSEPKITCFKGKVQNGACKCARAEKVVKTGKNAWSCVKVVVDPPRNKGKANVEVKTAPKKTAAPKLGKSGKAKGAKGKGKTAKQGNGSSISLDPTDVIVFVGPNNAGKSQALRELQEYIGSTAAQTVITGVKLRTSGTAEDLLAFLDKRASKAGLPSELKYSGLGYSLAARKIRSWWPGNLQQFRSLFCLRASQRSCGSQTVSQPRPSTS